MSEINTLLVPYQVDYQCDVCKAGNVVLQTNGIKELLYKCPSCLNTCILNKMYPYVIYK